MALAYITTINGKDYLNVIADGDGGHHRFDIDVYVCARLAVECSDRICSNLHVFRKTEQKPDDTL